MNREFIWGPLAPLAVWLYGKRIQGGLHMAADAVKARVEKNRSE